MSLINQMLKDLDARQAVASARHPLPSEVRTLPAAHPARRPWLVAGLAATLLVALLAAYLLLPAQRDAAVAPTAAAALSPAAAVPAAAALPQAPVPATETPPEVVAVAPSVVAVDLAAVPPPAAAPAVPAAAPSSAAASATPNAKTSTPSAKASVPVPKAPPLAAATPADLPRRAPQVAESVGTPAPAAGAPALSSAAVAVQPGKRGAIERSDAAATPAGRAEADYRKAIDALNQGRVAEAIDDLRAVLRADPLQRAARQLLVKVLLEGGRSDEAGEVLREGLQGQPTQIGWAMALARLQVDRGDLAGASTTLDGSLPAAGGSADYLGFSGNVLQRLGRSREAIARFSAAARLAPADGRWWLGLGLAHDAEGNITEAREAFLRARQSANLSPELMALVEQKLR